MAPPVKIGSSRDDLVYASPSPAGTPGCRNRKSRPSLRCQPGDWRTYSDLLRPAATQVTAFAPAPTAVSTPLLATWGNCFTLGSSAAAAGNTKAMFSTRIYFPIGDALEVRSSGQVELWVRAGNVDNPRPQLEPLEKLGATTRSTLPLPGPAVEGCSSFRKHRTHSGQRSGQLSAQNVAPEVTMWPFKLACIIRPSPRCEHGIFQQQPKTGRRSRTLKHLCHAVPDLDSIGVKWTAHDDNDDRSPTRSTIAAMESRAGCC